MKVFIVFEEQYDQTYVKSVYSSEEKAKKRVDTRKKEYKYASIWYDKFEVDSE